MDSARFANINRKGTNMLGVSVEEPCCLGSELEPTAAPERRPLSTDGRAERGVSPHLAKRMKHADGACLSQESCRAISAQVPGFAYSIVVHPDGRLTPEWITSGPTRLTGLTLEDLDTFAGNHGPVYPPDLPVLHQRARTLLSGQSHVCEFRIVTKTGEVRYLQDHSMPVWSHEENRVTHVHGAAHDVTDRKEYELMLETTVLASHAFMTAQSRAEVLPAILDPIVDVLRLDAAALVFQAAPNTDIVVEAARGAWASAAGLHLRPHEGVIGRVIASGEAQSPTAESREPLGRRPLDWTGNVLCATCIPLSIEDRVIGALAVGRRRPTTGAETEWLAVLAALAANAIQRVSLHEETSRLCRELADSQQFTSLILESIPSSLFILDRNLRVVSANRNFRVKTRRGEHSLIGRSLAQVMPEPLLQYARLDEKAQSVLSTGRSIDGGRVAYSAPGLPRRIYYYRLVPLEIQGSVRNVMIVMDDITRQEQLGEEVERIEQHLASVVDCANEMVVSMTREGRILTWNGAAESVSGRSAEEVKGQMLLPLCAPIDRPVMEQALRRLASGEELKNTESNLVSASGEEVPVAWSWSAMRNGGEDVTGIVAVGRDLRERRRLEAQLVQSAKMTSLGVMAGGIAHEVRNPLGVIAANAQLLLEFPEDDEVHTLCPQKIFKASERASVIIENLLRFAHPTNGRMRETDIASALDETLTLLAHQMAIQRIKLRKRVQPHLPRIQANPELLQQVFMNVVLNACKAMPQGGNLTSAISVPDPGTVEIRFTDTGCGIPPEHLPHVFEPFYTAMQTGKGTGMGLSICYSIVRQHLGTIEVNSEVGKGTTVVIRLPVAEALPVVAQ